MDHQEKERIRRAMRTHLGNLSRDECAARSARLAQRLAEWLGTRPRSVALFSAVRGEPDLASLHTLRPACSYLYPLVKGETLAFYEVAQWEELQRGGFGINEPDPARHRLVPLPEIDLFLCPGLAFSPDGVRLGRGKGYYDRALAHARPEVLRVGAAFASQIQPHLPAAPHDIPMSHLSTEEGVMVTGRL